jgi:uncharacterized protein YkwD
MASSPPSLARLLALACLVLSALLLAAPSADAAPRTGDGRAADSARSSDRPGARSAKHRSRGQRNASSGRRAARRRAAQRRAARRRAARRQAAARTVPAAGVPGAATPGAAATGASDACALGGTVPTAANLAAIRAAVLCLVNRERVAAGLPALADDPQLAVAAQRHSDDMVARAFFDHVTPEGVAPTARIAAAGYACSACAENIAYGSGPLSTPAQIVAGWMASPGHRANILNGALRHSGIGMAAGAPQAGTGGATYTQTFGTR